MFQLLKPLGTACVLMGILAALPALTAQHLVGPGVIDTGGSEMSYFAISAAASNPAAGVVPAGTADHLCLAFNVRRTGGSGGNMNGVTIKSIGTAEAGDWESMSLVHNGSVLSTVDSKDFPVTFNGFSVAMTTTNKTFQVLVTFSQTAVDGNIMQMTVSASDVSISVFGLISKAGGTITGGAQEIDNQEVLSELVVGAGIGNGTGGMPLETPPVVYLVNQFGEIMTDDSDTVVTAAIVDATGHPDGQIVAGATAQAFEGVVTFSDLAIDRAGAGYQLVFSVGGLASDPSEPFNVEVGPAHELRMVGQPGDATAGFTFGNQPRIEVVDAGGNLFIYDNSSLVVASIKEGTGTNGATLGGEVATAIEGGIAEWEDLAINLAGAGYQLVFEMEGVGEVASATFSVASPLSGGGTGSLGHGGGGCAGSGLGGLALILSLIALAGIGLRRRLAA